MEEDAGPLSHTTALELFSTSKRAPKPLGLFLGCGAADLNVKGGKGMKIVPLQLLSHSHLFPSATKVRPLLLEEKYPTSAFSWFPPAELIERTEEKMHISYLLKPKLSSAPFLLVGMLSDEPSRWLFSVPMLDEKR